MPSAADICLLGTSWNPILPHSRNLHPAPPHEPGTWPQRRCSSTVIDLLLFIQSRSLNNLTLGCHGLKDANRCIDIAREELSGHLGPHWPTYKGPLLSSPVLKSSCCAWPTAGQTTTIGLTTGLLVLQAFWNTRGEAFVAEAVPTTDTRLEKNQNTIRAPTASVLATALRSRHGAGQWLKSPPPVPVDPWVVNGVKA